MVYSETDVWIVMEKLQASLRQIEDASKSCRIIWLKYASVIALRQKGNDKSGESL